MTGRAGLWSGVDLSTWYGSFVRDALFVCLDEDVTTKVGAFRRVLELLAERRTRANVSRVKVSRVLDLVLSRERSGTTNFGHGIAIPHVILPGWKGGPCVAWCMLHTAIAYDGQRDEPVRFVHLFLSGDEEDRFYVSLAYEVLKNEAVRDSFKGLREMDCAHPSVRIYACASQLLRGLSAETPVRAEDSALYARFTVVNQLGIHARPSKEIAQVMHEMDCLAQMRVVSTPRKSPYNVTDYVDMSSIMELMMLAATKGCVVEMRTWGVDAEIAIAEIGRLIGSGFDEW